MRSNHSAGLVMDHIKNDTHVFRADVTVSEVLETIKGLNLSDQIVYLYVADNDKKIKGVLPVRRLLSARSDQKVAEIMIANVVTLPAEAPLEKAYDVFARSKFLSLPVVDKTGKFVGVLDVTALTEADIGIGNKSRYDDIFETIGLRYSVGRLLTPHGAFLHRIPWLLPTLLSGMICALLAGLFEKTLEESIIIAFFLTLVLGLGESISIQSLSITIKRLHIERPSIRWFSSSVKREFLTAVYLGLTLGIVTGLIAFFWKRDYFAALSIAASIVFSLVCANIVGFLAPTIIHAAKLDPKIAAGPIALGVSDVITVLAYFGIATAVL